MPDMRAFDKDDFVRLSNVSRETLQDYTTWHELLCKWNAKINLIAPSTLEAFWGRHALDSWQICPLLPDNARTVLDFGSGAGFPAIAAAIHTKHRSAQQAAKEAAQEALKDAASETMLHVHLVESAGKKASFLKTVIRELDLPATVHSQRIEAFSPMRADVITARAFAPLPRLFQYALPHSQAGTLLILPKGENAKAELESAASAWTFSLETVKSITQDDASVLIVKNLARKA